MCLLFGDTKQEFAADLLYNTMDGDGQRDLASAGIDSFFIFSRILCRG